MRRDYRWEDFVGTLFNIFAVIFILPVKGLWWLVKKVISDVGKKMYANFVTVLASVLFLALVSLLFR